MMWCKVRKEQPQPWDLTICKCYLRHDHFKQKTLNYLHSMYTSESSSQCKCPARLGGHWTSLESRLDKFDPTINPRLLYVVEMWRETLSSSITSAVTLGAILLKTSFQFSRQLSNPTRAHHHRVSIEYNGKNFRDQCRWHLCSSSMDYCSPQGIADECKLLIWASGGLVGEAVDDIDSTCRCIGDSI